MPPAGTEGRRACAELEDGYELNDLGTRAAARAQAPPQERPCPDRATSRWSCYADVAKRKTGKASGWTREQAGPFYGVDSESASAERSAFIVNYMNPSCRRPAMKKRARAQEDDINSNDLERVPYFEGKRRSTAATEITYAIRGVRGGASRAGPGRGHADEATMPLLTADDLEHRPVPFPSLPSEEQVTAGNWLQQLSLKKSWQTAAMGKLEERIGMQQQMLAQNDLLMQQKDETIHRLRDKVQVA